MPPSLEIPTARVFQPLLLPARYKGAHGGRGSAKSHFFAEYAVEEAFTVPGTRIVCIREIQKSLAQSVKLLIETKIADLGLGSNFEIRESFIRAPGDGLISFIGMQSHTADSIKSLQGVRIAWVEEAQSLSERSLRLLRPTIREPNSQIWFSWNPESPEDPVDQLFRGEGRITDDVIVVESNWRDNPWFPEILEAERRRDYARDPDEYAHVWEGQYLTLSDAIIFRHRVAVEEFETPKNVRFFHGADWGFSQDPTVLVRCFVKDDCLYVDREAFGYHVELDETPALFDSIDTARKWPIKADAARPETISHIRKKGFPQISGAEKWKGSVEDGIACLKSFKRIVVHPRCPNIAKEFRMYSYKIDPRQVDHRGKPVILPIIVDKWNHGIDALRYALDGYIKGQGRMMISQETLNRI